MPEMNVNIYKSSGRPSYIRRFEFTEGGPCNLPDGSNVLHSQTFEDESGAYLEIWAAVPEESSIAHKQVNIHGDQIPSPDTPVILDEYERRINPYSYPDEYLESNEDDEWA